MLLITAAALLAPRLSGWPFWTRAAVSLVAAGFGASALFRHWRPPFRRIAYEAAGWMLIGMDGQEHAVLLASHVHLGALLAMDFQHGSRAHFRAVFAPDNLDPDTRRRLILMLARAEVAQAR